MLATKKNCQRVLAGSLRVVSAMAGNPPLTLCCFVNQILTLQSFMIDTVPLEDLRDLQLR